MYIRMKKIFFTITIVILSFSVFSCGPNDPSVSSLESVPGSPTLSTLPEIAADNVIAADQSEHMNIQWAYNLEIFDTLASAAMLVRGGSGSVFDYLNTKFNVKITGSLYIPPYEMEPAGPAELSISGAPTPAPQLENTPDIFPTNPYLAEGTGMTRTIPREMIEYYAPDYANALSVYNGWDINLAENGEYIGLSTFNAGYDRLDSFSLYRLDWLEAEGVQPHGELVELQDGVFFTPAAFPQDEFIQIMRAFSKTDVEKTASAANPTWNADNIGNNTFGIPLHMLYPNDSLAPLLGMYGINNEVVNDGGSAVPYYASAQYKAALLFISELESFNSIIRYYNFPSRRYNQVSTFSESGGTIGWSNISLPYIYQTCYTLLAREPEAKILITPPEIGGEGNSGVGILQKSSAFTPVKSWVIGSQVSDAKLIRILQIFNALSFDPETYVTAAYGIAGENFTWAGEPYQSAVIQMEMDHSRLFHIGGLVFLTDIKSDMVIQHEYYNGFPYLFDYALSPSARAMSGMGYKEEVWGKELSEKALIDRSHAEAINEIVLDYINKSANDNTTQNFDASWNEYMYKLNENGLGDYIDFYNQP